MHNRMPKIRHGTFHQKIIESNNPLPFLCVLEKIADHDDLPFL
jgi:hypothetical protein